MRFLLTIIVFITGFNSIWGQFDATPTVIDKSTIGVGNQEYTISNIGTYYSDEILIFKNEGSGNFTIHAASGNTIDERPVFKLINDDELIVLQKDPDTPTNWAIVGSKLAGNTTLLWYQDGVKIKPISGVNNVDIPHLFSLSLDVDDFGSVPELQSETITTDEIYISNPLLEPNQELLGINSSDKIVRTTITSPSQIARLTLLDNNSVNSFTPTAIDIGAEVINTVIGLSSNGSGVDVNEGVYLVTIRRGFSTSSSFRSSIDLIFLKDGQEYSRASSGNYIRRATGHNVSGDEFSEVYQFGTGGGEISFQNVKAEQSTSTSTTKFEGGRSILIIQRIQ